MQTILCLHFCEFVVRFIFFSSEERKNGNKSVQFLYISMKFFQLKWNFWRPHLSHHLKFLFFFCFVRSLYSFRNYALIFISPQCLYVGFIIMSNWHFSSYFPWNWLNTVLSMLSLHFHLLFSIFLLKFNAFFSVSF